MRVLQLALVACLAFGISACTSKPTTSRPKAPPDTTANDDNAKPNKPNDEGDKPDKTGKTGNDTAADTGTPAAISKDKLVGTWEGVEGQMKGDTIKVNKDGTVTHTHLDKNKKPVAMEGTWVLNGDTVTVTHKDAKGKEQSHKVKITKLTDDTMVSAGDDGKENTFKRK